MPLSPRLARTAVSVVSMRSYTAFTVAGRVLFTIEPGGSRTDIGTSRSMSLLNAAEGRIAASAFATSGIQYPPTSCAAPWSW